MLWFRQVVIELVVTELAEVPKCSTTNRSLLYRSDLPLTGPGARFF